MHEETKKPTANADSQQDRLVAVESSVTYLQFDLEQINQVVLDQQKQIERLQRHIEKLEEILNKPDTDLPDPDPVQDRPPHY